MNNQTTTQKRLVVLVSGRGTNCQALMNAANAGVLPNTAVSLVLSNIKDAGVLERAKKLGIPIRVVEHQAFDSRQHFEEAMIREIEPFAPDLVILAGFMRILTKHFVEQYEGRLLNIHPSILPRYPGLQTHHKAIDSGDSEHGATVHFVIEALDEGPHVIQGRVPIFPWDDFETLRIRMLPMEHQILIQAAKWHLDERLYVEGSQVFLDNKPLPKEGYQFSKKDVP